MEKQPEFISFSDMIITLKGRAPGVSASADDRKDLQDFLASRAGKFGASKVKADKGKISKDMLELLQKSYFCRIPREGNFISGAKACEALRIQTRNADAVNKLIRKIWLNATEDTIRIDDAEYSVEEVVSRCQQGKRTIIGIEEKFLAKLITKDAVLRVRGDVGIAA